MKNIDSLTQNGEYEVTSKLTRIYPVAHNRPIFTVSRQFWLGRDVNIELIDQLIKGAYLLGLNLEEVDVHNYKTNETTTVYKASKTT
jgi:hypothetical protein